MSVEQETLEKATLLSENHEAGLPIAHHRTSNPGQKRLNRQICFWAANALILIISILVNILTWRRSLPGACVFPTDMKDAHAAIEYEQRIFTGALVYDPEKKTAVRKQDGVKQYFGQPSQEIDAAWHDLLHGEFPVMTEEEAMPYLPDLTKIPTTKEYHFEPDMFHTLHCLNAVRLEVSKSLYNASIGHHHGAEHNLQMPDGWDVAHMEHCLDRIRQSVMCHGDLTPSPLYHWPGFNIALGRTGEHTCRKWQPIREWMDRRGEQGPVLEA